MVKVTVEQDGKVTQCEGALFMGVMATSKGEETECENLLIGKGECSDVIQILEAMAYGTLCRISDDQVEAISMLIDLSERLDKRIRKHTAENKDAFLRDMKKAILQMEKGMAP